jgi:hypothetical protein
MASATMAGAPAARATPNVDHAVTLADIFVFQEAWLRLPSRLHAVAALAWCPAGLGADQQVSARWSRADGTQVLSRAGAGQCLDRVPTPADLAANPPVVWSVPDPDTMLDTEFVPVRPLARTMDARALAGDLETLRRLAREVGRDIPADGRGYFQFAIEGFDAVAFRFGTAKPGRAEAITASGERRSLPVADRAVIFAPGDPRMRAVVRLEFENLPASALFHRTR